MTYGLIEGDAIARRAVAREGLATIPTPFGRYGLAPALALVPLAAPVVAPLTAEAMGILATMGLAGAGMSMMRPSSVSASGLVSELPDWHRGSDAWQTSMKNLSKSFKKLGGTIGDDCAWILSPATLMARVAQEAHRIATKSGRTLDNSMDSISKIMNLSRAKWASTMTGSKTWWMSILEKMGFSMAGAGSVLSGPIRAGLGYALSIVLPALTSGALDFAPYFYEATMNVGNELAACVKSQKRSLGAWLGNLMGQAFGAVISAVVRLMGKLKSMAFSLKGAFTFWVPSVVVATLLGGMDDYFKDNKLDDSNMARIWDLLDRTIRDSLVMGEEDPNQEGWRVVPG